MKVGMNLLVWTAFVTEEHFPILEKIKKTGYDGVEIPLFDGDAEHYKKIKKELDNLGLGCTAVTVVNADTNPISPDASIRKAGLERIKWALDMTSVMGGDLLAGPYHSALGVFSGQPPTADERKRAIEVLTQAADHAQKVKVKIAIEYLNRFECYFLTNAWMQRTWFGKSTTLTLAPCTIPSMPTLKRKISLRQLLPWKTLIFMCTLVKMIEALPEVVMCIGMKLLKH